MALGIILAGGQKAGFNPEGTPVPEALIPIGPKCMVEYVVQALEGSGCLDEIIISGPVPELRNLFPSDSYRLVESGDSPLTSFLNVQKSLESYRGKILIATADIPLLTPKAIEDFLQACSHRKAHIFYPIISKGDNENRFPGVKRTYVTLKEGEFTGGNLILLESQVVAGSLPAAEKFIRFRKRPLKLVSFLGWPLFLKYMLGTLSLKEAEDRVSQLLKAEVAGIISSFPEIGIDVDKKTDLDLVERSLCS